jgi:hypothetical protein
MKQLLALVPVLLLGLPLVLQAQPTRTFAISDGQVLVDGTALPPEALPEGLDLRGVRATLTFTDPFQPVIEIDGVRYQLEGQRLVEMGAEDEASARVYFFPSPGDLAPPAPGFLDGRGMEPAFAPANPGLLRQQFIRELADRSRSLDHLSSQIGVRPHVEVGPLVQQLRSEALAAAQAAQALPEVDDQAYLFTLRARDPQLYEQLVREHHLEAATQTLAQRIRSLTPGDERTRLLADLRTQLDAIFELKQQNRRNEIHQLEERIQELKRLLQQREQQRPRIIDNRLQHLIGTPPGKQW